MRTMAFILRELGDPFKVFIRGMMQSELCFRCWMRKNQNGLRGEVGDTGKCY